MSPAEAAQRELIRRIREEALPAAEDDLARGLLQSILREELEKLNGTPAEV